MRWSHREVRRLLSLFRQPRKLESEPLALLLRDALHAKSGFDALKLIIEKALAGTTPIDELLRNIIASRDLGGNKSRRSAAALGLSVRSYFRYRAMAMDAVARQIDLELRARPEQTTYEALLAEMVSRFEPQVAFESYRKAIESPHGWAAYNMLCLAIKAGRPITRELVEGCEGPWRALAMAALGRKYLMAGRPKTAQRWRTKVSRAINKLNTPVDHTAAFELAHFDRLEAVRRCDMRAAREAAQSMAWHAKSNSDLLGLALVAEVEQACDDGDLARAEVVLQALASFNATSRDFRVMGRTAHAQALLALMRGEFEKAHDTARLAAIALAEVEPGYSFCAHANVGRAALLAHDTWAPPIRQLERYPGSWITGMIYAVHSRHLLASDPTAARQAAQKALEIAIAQGAPGMRGWAQSSMAFALDRLGFGDQAAKLRIDAWESAVLLGRRSYLYDMFVHPAAVRRSLGAFELRPAYLHAATRWARHLIAEHFGGLPGGMPDVIDRAIQYALTASLSRPDGLRRPYQPAGPAAWPKSRNAGPRADEMAEFLAPRLARDIAICLPFAERDDFVRRFGETLRSATSDRTTLIEAS